MNPVEETPRLEVSFWPFLSSTGRTCLLPVCWVSAVLRCGLGSLSCHSTQESKVSSNRKQALQNLSRPKWDHANTILIAI